jgi:hypothetical protein
VPDLINPDEGMQFGKRSVAIAVFGYREIAGDPQPAYARNYASQYILNESMIVVSNGLEGKEISIGTYLESVCPEYLAGLSGSHKAALYNMTIPVSKIPVDSKTAVFVPPLYAAKTEFTFNPPERVNVAICGIFGLVVLAIAGIFFIVSIRKQKRK